MKGSELICGFSFIPRRTKQECYEGPLQRVHMDCISMSSMRLKGSVHTM